MSDLHIDDFYRDVAKTLALLYSHFPRRITLYVEDISGPDTPDEFGLHSPRHEACFHALLWLGYSDYLSYEHIVRQEAVDQVVLTHRAFLLLNSPADGASAQQPLNQALPVADGLVIHKLREQLKKGTSFSLADTVRTVLQRSRQYGETGNPLKQCQ